MLDARRQGQGAGSPSGRQSRELLSDPKFDGFFLKTVNGSDLPGSFNHSCTPLRCLSLPLPKHPRRLTTRRAGPSGVCGRAQCPAGGTVAASEPDVCVVHGQMRMQFVNG